MKFEVGKIYIARDKSRWRVLATDAKSTDGPIITIGMGDRYVQHYYPCGRYILGRESPEDLIREAREPREWTLQQNGATWWVIEPGKTYAHESNPTVRVREILETEND